MEKKNIENIKNTNININNNGSDNNGSDNNEINLNFTNNNHNHDNHDNHDNNNNHINSQDILDAIDLNKINDVEKKRRGRPRKKDFVIPSGSKIKSNVPKNNYDLEDEEIILHLPLSKADLANIDTDTIDINKLIGKNNYSTQKSSTQMNLIVSENESEKNNKRKNKKIESDKNDEENDDDNDENDNDENDNDNLLNIIDNNQHVKQLCLAIKKLKDENVELKKFINDLTPMYFTEVKVYPSNLNLFDTNQNKITPKKTNLCCWWCTCPFDNLPTYLPEKYSENKFYVSGCFCSFNCAGAYNLALGDNKVWDRYSLLKLMYYQINKDKINSIGDIDINIAGPKELLDKYGGPMSIEEYRKNSKILGREYHKLIPPFIPINLGFEEITNSKINSNVQNISSILNGNKNSDNLVKRLKPLNNSASKQIDNFV